MKRTRETRKINQSIACVKIWHARCKPAYFIRLKSKNQISNLAKEGKIGTVKTSYSRLFFFTLMTFISFIINRLVF